jgi:hypothetical protein
MTRVPPVTAQPKDSQGSHAKRTQEEVARSLERELRLLAEERHDRARRLGFNIEAPTPKVRD